MRRYVMPLLLIAAIGAPICIVYFSDHASFRDSIQGEELGNESANQTTPSIPNNAPISVYSQASYTNPAPNLNASDASNFAATPMEFVPTVNLAEIFRFDISPNWVKNRWERVSTTPGEIGLKGLRVALVTGTSRTDLHGSLTYLFGANQRCQRITFRGWTGDSGKLVSLLTQQYGFQEQPTKWAGFYLAKNRTSATGGLLMKHPTVISAKNPSQQIAMVLEINNPEGQISLSRQFLSSIAAAAQVR